MIALSKKDTPKQFHAMWWAAWLNLAVATLNLILGNLFMAAFSLTVCCVILYVIKRYTTQMLWDKLTRPNIPGVEID